ncbi:hypothetical protein VAC51_00008 [Variovorax phage VAC_51]|uniref:Uncharacterized protein n=1 Tax=Variovorax phage VAC_51 TaxID=2985242 RepID=A0A9N6ZGK9_9CAUD|nr:hypothetical protein VAC51_00008 [Variovorax phage VAC_51]
MAVDITTAYSITHQAEKLGRAAYAMTLTNNPAPGVAAVLDDEVAATLSLLDPGALPSTSAVVEAGVTYQMLVNYEGDDASLQSLVFNVIDGQLVAAQLGPAT